VTKDETLVSDTVFLLEALNSTRGIHELLLPSEEWVTARTNFNLQFFGSRASLYYASACASDSCHLVFGMDALFHYSILRAILPILTYSSNAGRPHYS